MRSCSDFRVTSPGCLCRSVLCQDVQTVSAARSPGQRRPPAPLPGTAEQPCWGWPVPRPAVLSAASSRTHPGVSFVVLCPVAGLVPETLSSRLGSTLAHLLPWARTHGPRRAQSATRHSRRSGPPCQGCAGFGSRPALGPEANALCRPTPAPHHCFPDEETGAADAWSKAPGVTGSIAGPQVPGLLFCPDVGNQARWFFPQKHHGPRWVT